MSLKAGIVGLPNVGKSTLFSALTKKQVESSNYPFTTIEPNVSTVALKDKRLDLISEIVKPNKIIHATFDFVGIAGLVQGASKGEGLGNKFLSNIREVDAIIHVIRCFEDKDILHVNNTVDPIRDADIINIELILADLETINNVLNRIAKKAKSGDKESMFEQAVAQKIKSHLESEKSVRDLELDEKELKAIRSYQLLSAKPMIYVANASAEQLQNLDDPNNIINKVKSHFKNKTKVVSICVQVESELLTIENEQEALDFLALYNIETSGLDMLTREAFDLLSLETYFTAGVVEVRAWVYKKGIAAPAAAGIIHSNFEKKFIKADVISYQDFIDFKGEVGARNAGKLRQEGKTYIMHDGDICHFKFGK
ncbi:redox-regulated ATPase YchF [Mycoplasmopsis alligatoris]|uniref:Ribosome-binding ATPase YchF n=1 Tax=Mycoplasmopsis alligatoris A21JP2 TaxID=747682 RepID=D4XVM2_9BACT|nr:redox-regulated ATPase YchF [Mycoplasmopsis alligatoris]EFF41645.1 GTP-binding protein YchF [Mycoplasmopsis alligatoris A21JP2]